MTQIYAMIGTMQNKVLFLTFIFKLMILDQRKIQVNKTLNFIGLIIRLLKFFLKKRKKKNVTNLFFQHYFAQTI